MKKHNHLYFSFLLLISAIVAAGLNPASACSNAGCSVAGTPSATADSICVNTLTTLNLTGYLGNIQWQSFDGTNWNDETGTGSTTDAYDVTLNITTDFRAVVTELGCPPDTSVVLTITVGLAPPTTTGASRCGYGPVTLSATGGGAIMRWYDVPTGGTSLGTGSTFTPTVAATTTFYAAAASNGGGAATPAITPHSNIYTGFTRGYWFTAPIDFTITSLYVPTDASTDNQSIAVLMFPVGPPPVDGTAVMGFTTLFMSQNNPSTIALPVNIPVLTGQHIVIIGNRGSDTTGNFTAINSYDSGAAFSTTIDGNSVVLNRAGMQSCLTGFAPITTGLLIVNGAGQRGRIEFSYEIGCESVRTPAVATVTPSAAISINATPPALCQGQSSTITVSSVNPNYSYTWSPATGLSGTTGTSNNATPAAPITYTIIADDGTCGAIDSVFIDVGPASAAGTAAITSDTICLGTDAFLTLAGYTGNIQWQGNDGSGWVDETGTGSTTNNYAVSPPIFTQYRAVVTSGGCDPDTTVTLDLAVITIVDPLTVNDTICAPGFASLSASGPGTLDWFTSPSGGISIHTGAGYSPNIATTTTYYVQASAGGIYPTGPANLSIGAQIALAGNDYGLQFDVVQQCILERVYVSPGLATGNITINLRDQLGGPILNTVTVPVTAFSGLVPVPVNFTLNPGTAYRLELATGSVQLYHNSTGAIYPYTSAGSPVTITGAVNPNFNAGMYYYFFYNWEVKVGCSSNLIPVTGFVNSPPAVPSISQNGTVLTSSAPSGNQWYLNGNMIIGATGTTHDMTFTGSGSYTVIVTIDGCSSTSLPIIYTSINDLSGAGISVYPNPVSNVLNISVMDLPPGKTTMKIYNAIGELLQSEEISQSNVQVPWTYPAGSYGIEISTENGKYVTRIVKL